MKIEDQHQDDSFELNSEKRIEKNNNVKEFIKI